MERTESAKNNYEKLEISPIFIIGAERSGTTLVMVTHDSALAEYADRRITLRDGLVVADEAQTPKEFALDEVAP